jgi:hypothetical protein
VAARTIARLQEKCDQKRAEKGTTASMGENEKLRIKQVKHAPTMIVLNEEQVVGKIYTSRKIKIVKLVLLT